MTIAVMLIALMLAACGSAPKPTPTAGSRPDQTTAHHGISAAPQAACAYPGGRILIIENRLEAIKAVKPKYPEKAKALHIEGPVEVTTLVDQNGDVTWACGRGNPALTSSAQEAARECKFPKNFGAAKPWISGRTPVVLRFDFRLDESR
jgi:TonB family protein